MAQAPLTDEEVRRRVDAYNAAGRNQVNAALALGISREALQRALKIAAQRGIMLQHPPAMPGYRISQGQRAPMARNLFNRSPNAARLSKLPLVI